MPLLHTFMALVFLVHFSDATAQPATGNASDTSVGESTKNVTAKLLQVIEGKRHLKFIRPLEGGEAVNVKAGIHITYIGNFRESDMEYTIEMYFRQYWKDPRLAAAGLNQSVTFSGELPDSLWQPDTYFENAISARLHHITILNKYLRLYPDGRVLVSTRLTMSCSCDMDFRRFPMDTQICDLYFASYGFTTRDLIYSWNDEFVTYASQREIAQFSLEKFSYLNGTRTYAPGNFSYLGIRFFFARRLSFYLAKVYIPAMLVVFVSWLSFFVDKNSVPARVSLGITTVLTMTTLIMGFGQGASPIVSYVRALDWYLIACYMMVFGSFAEYAVVSYKQNHPPHTASNKSAVNSSGWCEEDTFPSERKTNTKNVETPPVGHEKRSSSISNITVSCARQKLLEIQRYPLDEWSRMLFLPVFILLNVFYWVYYLVVLNTKE